MTKRSKPSKCFSLPSEVSDDGDGDSLKVEQFNKIFFSLLFLSDH